MTTEQGGIGMSVVSRGIKQEFSTITAGVKYIVACNCIIHPTQWQSSCQSQTQEVPIPIKTNMYKADGAIWLIYFWIEIFSALQTITQEATFHGQVRTV